MQSPKTIITAIVLTLASVSQIVLSFILFNEDGISPVRNIGWIILWISAVFGWLPIYTFKKWGGVQAGESYIKTTKLVDRGVYSIVRHPQYLAGILISISLPLIAQNWIVSILGILLLFIYYFDTFEEERNIIEQFGEQYIAYKKSVPRINVILGIIRLLLRKQNGT